MKNKLKLVLCGAAVACSALLGLWYWQANHAERLRSISVPQWIAGGGNVSYSIAVHKSQIKQYGTVWKMTVGDGRRAGSVEGRIPWPGGRATKLTDQATKTHEYD